MSWGVLGWVIWDLGFAGLDLWFMGKIQVRETSQGELQVRAISCLEACFWFKIKCLIHGLKQGSLWWGFKNMLVFVVI